MVPWVLARAKVATAIGVIALAAVIAALATYQTVATAKPERALPPPPLTVIAEEQDGYVALRLTNVGTKEIAGYAIVLKLREATRPRGLKAVHTMLVGHAADKTSPGRQAGESWIDQTATFKRRGSDRSKQLRIESSVDYVLYSDGRGWGVDAERRSLFLAGMRSGAASGVQHLVSVLRDSGSEALGKEVERLAQTSRNPVLPVKSTAPAPASSR